MIHPCCICGYRVPLSSDFPFDTRYKELSLCKDCKAYLEAYENNGKLYEVAGKYLKMMLSSNNLMDSRVRGYLNGILGVAEVSEPEKERKDEGVHRL